MNFTQEEINKRLPEMICSAYIDLKGINHRVPFINNGGCGIFAEKLYDLFNKFNLKPKIMLLGYDKEILENEIRNNDISSSDFWSHIFVGVDDCYYDSRGYGVGKPNGIKHYGKTMVMVEISIDLLRATNKNVGCWNPKFNRAYVPVIEEIFNEIYDELSSFLEELKKRNLIKNLVVSN